MAFKAPVLVRDLPEPDSNGRIQIRIETPRDFAAIYVTPSAALALFVELHRYFLDAPRAPEGSTDAA